MQLHLQCFTNATVNFPLLWLNILLASTCMYATTCVEKTHELDENRSFLVDEDLLMEEERLAQIENTFLQNIEFTHWDEVNSVN